MLSNMLLKRRENHNYQQLNIYAKDVESEDTYNMPKGSTVVLGCSGFPLLPSVSPFNCIKNSSTYKRNHTDLAPA